MKKIQYLILALIFLGKFSVVKAETILEVNSYEVGVGETFTVDLLMKEEAAWNLHMTSSGPVKDCAIHEADVSLSAKNITKTFTAYCTATAEGIIKLSLSGDTTKEDGKTSEIFDNKEVKVVSTVEKTVEIDSSNNTKIMTVMVENYEATKVDETHYQCIVPLGTKTITVMAEAEDSRTTVVGLGEKTLTGDKNTFEITAKAEDGTQQIYYLDIMRKNQEQKNLYAIFMILLFITLLLVVLELLRQRIHHKKHKSRKKHSENKQSDNHKPSRDK